MYFNTVLTDSAKLLKPLLVFTFAMLAILAGLTRIIQFRNHPVDVYWGWTLGAAIAAYLVTPPLGLTQGLGLHGSERGSRKWTKKDKELQKDKIQIQQIDKIHTRGGVDARVGGWIHK